MNAYSLQYYYSLAGFFRFSIIYTYYKIFDKEGFVIYNPFLKDGVLSLNASINKLIIAKMPDCSVTQDLTGKSAQDIFSTNLFIEEIKKSSDKLQIDTSALQEKSLPLYLETCLESSNTEIYTAASNILKIFGERLAVILLCLDEGTPENRNARKDWDDSHWKYWNSIEQIIMVGGLASPPLGNYLKQNVEQVFKRSGKKPYQLILGEDSTYAGLKGCTTFLENNADSQVNLIFDYGQSFIKRSYVITENSSAKDESNIDIIILDKTLSQHVDWDIKDPDVENKEAILLNNHFLKTITKTINEVEQKGYSIHPHIILSIANYVKDGVIANRGGYGKLRLIAPNYADYLSAWLKNNDNKDFHFTLVHDGTAMAAGYADYKKSVCLSLGTAFGVGFPGKYHI